MLCQAAKVKSVVYMSYIYILLDKTYRIIVSGECFGSAHKWLFFVVFVFFFLHGIYKEIAHSLPFKYLMKLVCLKYKMFANLLHV